MVALGTSASLSYLEVGAATTRAGVRGGDKRMELSNHGKYLAAKKSVDDRALNRVGLHCLAERVQRMAPATLRVIEVGAGLGTMPARLIERGILRRADYTLLDSDVDLLCESLVWLQEWAAGIGLETEDHGDALQITGHNGTAITLRYVQSELSTFLRSSAGQYDLVIASAVLDLVDVPALMPRLLGQLSMNGLYWFSINFDGETILMPELPEDEPFMRAYHRSLDERKRNGTPARDSRLGRHMFQHLFQAGAKILSAGSSDWVVYPRDNKYPHAEGDFLRYSVRTIDEVLQRHPEIQPSALRSWVDMRMSQIDRGELIYIAHQLDFVGTRG